MKIVRSSDGDTVPYLLWSLFQRDDDAAEELVYKANPGIEKYGPILPAGIEINFPDLPVLPVEQVVNLWD
jgi:phage tail protein X